MLCCVSASGKQQAESFSIEVEARPWEWCLKQQVERCGLSANTECCELKAVSLDLLQNQMAVEVLEQLRSISGQQSKIRRMREKLALFRQVRIMSA